MQISKTVLSADVNRLIRFIHLRSVAVRITQQIYTSGDAVNMVTAMYLEFCTIILFSNIKAVKHTEFMARTKTVWRLCSF